jgi:hypothetical protein
MSVVGSRFLSQHVTNNIKTIDHVERNSVLGSLSPFVMSKEHCSGRVDEKHLLQI